MLQRSGYLPLTSTPAIQKAKNTSKTHYVLVLNIGLCSSPFGAESMIGKRVVVKVANTYANVCIYIYIYIHVCKALSKVHPVHEINICVLGWHLIHLTSTTASLLIDIMTLTDTCVFRFWNAPGPRHHATFQRPNRTLPPGPPFPSTLLPSQIARFVKRRCVYIMCIYIYTCI